jgi:serine/threonine protein phosphatase PrpC
MQGWRKSNEDAHITAVSIEPGVSLFAVFDGHGGREVAKYCEAHFVQLLKLDREFQTKNYEQALKNVFLKIDVMILKPEAQKELKSYSTPDLGQALGATDLAFSAGCTANVILITSTHIYCAHAGDARSVLCENGKAIDLSKDHKPDVPIERSRVVASGHTVENGRVDGVIAISRAIGDWEYKSVKEPPERMAVSAVPEISKTAITANSNFIIQACDGIWDCMTSQ